MSIFVGVSVYIVCNLLWFLISLCYDKKNKVNKCINDIYEELDHDKVSLALVEIILVLIMAFISIPGTVVAVVKRRNK